MPLYFDYEPHPAQMQIHLSRGVRFRAVCTGRRFGKTRCLAAELLDRGGSECGGDYGWVAPTYNVADRGIEAFKAIAGDFAQVCGRAPSRIEFSGKAGRVRIWFLSADNPDNIRGYGFRGLVIDEAASMPQAVWTYVLRPTIAQTLGWAVFCSTPKGRNWFYDLHVRGRDKSEPDYASFTFPSNASPYFPAAEWADAKRTLPADVFRQEYMAEFLQHSAGVFRGIDGCLVPMDPAAELLWRNEPRGNVIIGCDIAKHRDWTVLIAMEAATGKCFDILRFNQLDWGIQKDRIIEFSRKYRAPVIIDATGAGDPIFDDLRRELDDVEGFKFTAASKTLLIQRLIVAVEQRRVSWPEVRVGGCVAGGECGADRAAQIVRDTGPSAALSRDGADTYPAPLAEPCGRVSLTHSRAGALPYPIRATVHPIAFGDDTGSAPHPMRSTGHPIAGAMDTGMGLRLDSGPWDVLTNEMRRYEYQLAGSGGITYNAPAGLHDDCVIALALANQRRIISGHAGSMAVLAGNSRMDSAFRLRTNRTL